MADWRHVLVVGVGLIGGSFAAAVKHKGLTGRVSGIAPEPSLSQALALGLIDDGQVPSAQLDDLIASADLIMLAAPVMSLPEWLQRIAPNLSANAIVSDCGSTKSTVIAAARRYLGSASSRFVAGHPIAGSERSGPTAARATLFKGARVILCRNPTDSTGKVEAASNDDAAATQAHDRVTGLWRALGAHVSQLDPLRHDRLYAAVSHWPHALVFALTGALAGSDIAEDAIAAAGAGLRDTTRIGASSPSLWAEIVLDNRDQVLAAADEFQLELDRLLVALKAADRPALEAMFGRAASWRQRIK